METAGNMASNSNTDPKHGRISWPSGTPSAGNTAKRSGRGGCSFKGGKEKDDGGRWQPLQTNLPHALGPRLADKLKPLSDEAEAIDKKLLEVEAAFFDPRITGGADSFYYPPKLFSQLQGLVSDISESDFPPTQAQLDVYQMFKKQVEEQKSRLDALLSTDLQGFNARLKESGIPFIEPKTD